METVSDVQLISNIGQKELDHEMIAQIYQEYAGAVFNFLYYKFSNKEAAEDLTSEIFVRVIEKYSYYNPDKGSFKVWLFTIARNMLRDEFRRMGRRQTYPIDELFEIAGDSQSPEEQAVIRIEMQQVVNALPALSEKARNLLALKYGAGLRNNEIAAITHLSEKNVGVILCRSIAKLRKMMGDELNGI